MYNSTVNPYAPCLNTYRSWEVPVAEFTLSLGALTQFLLTSSNSGWEPGFLVFATVYYWRVETKYILRDLTQREKSLLLQTQRLKATP